MALAIDPSTPAYVSATGSTFTNTLTTASFTPPVGSRLAVCFSNADTTVLQSVPTNTGGTVSWDATATKTEALNSCCASIWCGTVTASAPMTVTGHVTGNPTDWGIGVVVVTGQAATQNGATQLATSGSGTPSATIASLVGANSLILGCVANFTNATGPTIPAGQSDSFNSHTYAVTDAGNGSSFWAQYLTGMNLAAGSSATLNDTAPTGIAFSMVMVEILAAAGGGGGGATSSPAPERLMTMGCGC